MKTIPARKNTISTALAVSAVLAVSGCAFDAESGGEGSDERISLAMMQPPTAALHPYSDDVAKISRWSTGETLMQLNEDIEPEPMLAQEWDRVDDLTWVFTLREDVTFHDGTQLNAESVKNTLDHASEAATPPRALGGVTLTTEVTGDYEVTIRTESPDALLANRLASPQLSIFAEDAYLDDGTVTPVGTGTGPFELTATGGATTATLDRYEDYWGDTAQIAGIDVSFVPDGTARAGAIRSGEADVAESIPVSQVNLLDEEQVHEVFMPRTTYVALNAESGPFADAEVRAAAREAIDPESAVDSVYEGQADPGEGFLGPAIPWAEELRGDISSSAEPADVDGEEITLATYSDRAENVELAVLIADQLEEAGFVVTQDVREYSNMESEMLDGEFDAVVISRNILLDTGDPLSVFEQDFTCNGGFNIAQLCDDDIDEFIAERSQLDDIEERQIATMEIEEEILSLDVAIPVVHDRVVQAENGLFINIERDPLERLLINQYTEVE